MSVLSAPTREAAFGEIATLFELPRLLLRATELLQIDAGVAGPVLVLPGFGANDASTSVMRAFLRRIGFDAHGWGLDRNHRHRQPIAAPVTAIYSRADGIVAWRACIDPWTPDVEHVEVGSTHLGLGFDPDVYRIVAERLARPRPSARMSGA